MVQVLLKPKYVVLLLVLIHLPSQSVLQLQVSRHLQNAMEMREEAASVLLSSHSFDAVTLKFRQSPLGKVRLECGE